MTNTNSAVIDDETASTLWGEYETAPPERQLAIRPQLEAFAQQKLDGDRQSQEAHVDRIYSDFDTMGGWWQETDDGTPHDDESKARIANRQFISLQTGHSPDELRGIYPTIRDQWTGENLGKTGLTERQTYDLIKQGIDEKKKVSAAYDQIPGEVMLGLFGNLSSGQPVNVPELVTSWKQKKAEALSKLPKGWEASAIENASRFYSENEAILKEHAPTFQKVYDYLSSATGRKAEGVSGSEPKSVEDFHSLVDDLAAMPSSVRNRAYSAIVLASRQAGVEPKGFFQQWGESWGRNLNMLRSGALNSQEIDTEARLKLLRNDTIKTLYRNTDTGAIVTPVERAFDKSGLQPIPDDERQRMAGETEKELSRFTVYRELRDVADNRFDPITNKNSGWKGFGESMAYGSAQSAGYTATALIPFAGPWLTMSAIASDEYDKLRLSQPDMSPADAKVIAGISAPIQTMFEVFPAKAAFGMLPAFEGVMKRWANPAITGTVKRMAIRGGALLAGENATEAVQDITTPFVQEVVGALNEDVPDVNWKSEFAQWKGTRADTLAALLPMILVGAGGVVLSEDARSRAFVDRRENWASVGFSDDQIAKIESGHSVEEIQAIAAKEWDKRTPENIQAAAKRIEDQMQAARNFQEDQNTPSIASRDLGNGDREYSVYSTDGRELFSSTDEQAAYAALHEESKNQEQRRIIGEKAMQATDEGILSDSMSGALGSMLTPQGDGTTNAGDESARSSGDPEAGPALKAEITAAESGFASLGVPVVRSGATERARVVFDPSGSISVEVNPAYVSELESGLANKGVESGRGTVTLLGEELAHASHLVALKADWEAAGRSGSFVDFVKAQHRAIFDDVRSTIEVAPDTERQALLEAVRASHHIYASNLGEPVRDTVNPETLLGEIANGNPVSFVAEFLRQATELRRNGRISEEVYSSLWDRLAAWVQGAIDKIKTVLPGAYEGRFGKLAQEHLAKIEAVLARENPQQSAPTGEQASIEARRTPVDPKARQKAIDDAIEKLNKKPAERLAVYQRAKTALNNLRDRHREALDALRAKNATGDKIKHTELLQAMGKLDAIISVLPAEIRGKVGGFTDLARFKTTPSRDRILAERIEKAGGVLEDHLKTSYIERIRESLKNSEPKKSDSNLKTSTLGPEAQADVDFIGSVIDLPENSVSSKLDELSAKIDAETDAETLSNLSREWGFLQAFGNLDSKSAAELAGAHEDLRDIIDHGREGWRIMEEARMEEVRGWRNRVQKATQKRPVTKTALNEANAKVKSALGRFSGYFHSLLDFTQVLEEIAIDPQDQAMREISDMHRHGKNAFEDKMASIQVAYRKQLPGLLNVKSFGEALDRMHRLETENVPGVTVLEGEIGSMERLKVETVRLALDGKAPGLKLSQSDLRALAAALAENDAKPPGKRKQFLEWNRQAFAGNRVETKMTQMEAANYLMAWRQPDVREKLTSEGLDEQTISEIESTIDPEARNVINWLSDYYDHQYDRINAVYRRMYGMNLPRVEFYSPTSFDNPKSGQQGVGLFDDLAGQSGLMASFNKTRQRHGWRFKQRSALNAFWSHVYNSEYWITHAETARLMRGIFNDKRTREVIETSAGKQAMAKMDSWMMVHEKNGITASKLGEDLDLMMRSMFRRYAMMTLGYKVTSNLLNMTAAFASSIEIGAVPFLKGVARLSTGQLSASLGDVWKSNTIQRRLINGFSPEVRLAMQITKQQPSKLLRIAEAGVGAIGTTDAAFTTISAAIAYDHHFRTALKTMPEEQARAVALDQMDRTSARTAQPASAMDKSLIENNNNPFYGFAYLFVSEQRQKAAISLLALKRLMDGRGGKLDNLRKFAVPWVAMPLMAEIIRAAYKSLLGNDDRDPLPPEKILATVLAGQSSGVLVWGQMVETLSSLMLGEWWASKSNNPVTATVSGAYSELTQGDYDPSNWDDWEDAARSIQKMMKVAGIFNDKAAAVASLMNPVVDAAQLADKASQVGQNQD